jgi:BirA family biotin operon repressor/biotin-[acetyl-CoA-carboxylase] ligase
MSTQQPRASASRVHGEAQGWAKGLAGALRSGLASGGFTPVLDVHVVPVCDSTQDVARELARAGKRDFAVIAERQTSGRGRLGRNWEDTGAKGLALTFACEARAMPAEQVSLRAGLASCLACERVLMQLACRQAVGLRWPNDVVVDTGKVGQRMGRKLSGVLVESEAVAGGERVLLVGIGINVLQRTSDWPPGLRRKAVSLGDLASVAQGEAEATLVLTAAQLLRSVHEVWMMREEQVVALWQPRSLLQGAWAMFDCAGDAGLERVEGVVEVVDPLARLSVRTKTGVRQLVAQRTTLRHDLMA